MKTIVNESGPIAGDTAVGSGPGRNGRGMRATKGKPGQLTEAEYEHIKMHPEIGCHILEVVLEDKETLNIVKHHHERYDGQGYPAGLSAGQIPLGARVLAVADSFDAMTSKRPYRGAMEPRMACPGA